MILKGNARSGSANLARHLMNTRDNDRVEIAEMRGVAAADFHGALMDMEAVASGTKCRAHLYSLSINPREPLSREQYAAAIDRIEDALGLSGQARVVVFHHKESKTSGESREHAHVVWSRIDPDTMKAKQLSFDHMTLRTMARELAIEFGHEVPKNIANDRGAARFSDRFNGLTWAQVNQEQRTGLNPAERKAEITAAFRSADSGVAFINALEERGYYLAQGTSRGFVVVDTGGEVHALARQIEGARSKDVAAKLAPLTPDQLPDVEKAKQFVAQRQAAAAERNVAYAPTISAAEAQEHRHKELLKAQAAELKGMRATFAKERATLKEQESASIDAERQHIREQHRPEWKGLFKRQKSELEDLKKLGGNFYGRLTYFVRNRDMLRFADGDRGILKHAYNFIARGRGDLVMTRLEGAHMRERKALAQEQRKQTRDAIREIKVAFAPHHADIAKDQAERRDKIVGRHAYQNVFSNVQVQAAQAKSPAPVELKGHYKVEEERARKSESITAEKYADAAKPTQTERFDAALKRFDKAMTNKKDFERKL